jgi:hypothetical protein
MTNPLDKTLREITDCSCYAGTAIQTPVVIYNRPGLEAIAFRAGTHPQFKATLMAALSNTTWLTQQLKDAGLQETAGRFAQTLSQLTTRTDDDFTIALLDGWSTIADVITFYNERIINEAYLRTATERRSILELARAIGYELKPGVAASAWLAFTVEDARGTQGYANIPAGTKVQSIPGPDETPQIFETGVELKPARAEWNAIAARSARQRTPAFGDCEIWLQGTGTNLIQGDAILIVGEERINDPGSEQWDFRLVRNVTVDRLRNRTYVTWEEGLGKKYGTYETPPANKNVKFYALRQRVSVFGHNAPDWRTLPASAQAAYLGLDDGSQVYSEEKMEWPDFNIYAPVFPEQRIPAPRTVYPTAEEVADAAKKAAEEAAAEAERQVSAAVMGALQATADVVVTFIKAVESVKTKLEQAALDATAEYKAVYEGDESEVAVLLSDLKEIVELIKIKFPDYSDIDSLPNKIKNAIQEMLNFGLSGSWPTLSIPGVTGKHSFAEAFKLKWGFRVPPFDFGDGPSLTGDFPSLTSPKLDTDFLSLANAIKDFLKCLIKDGISLEIPSDVAGKLVTIGNILSKLFRANPAFLPFNTLRIFINQNVNSVYPDKSFIELTNALQKAIESVEKARHLIGSIAAVPEARLIALAITKVVDSVLQPPAEFGFPATTPETVAAAARITAKVAKYAAILSNPSSFLIKKDNDPPELNIFVRSILNLRDLPHEPGSYYFNSICTQIVNFSTPDINNNDSGNIIYNSMPKDFNGLKKETNPQHFEEDRFALALVIGAAGLVAGTTLAAATLTVALTEFATLSGVLFIATGGISEGIAALLAAPLLLLAPFFLTIATVTIATAITGAIIAGPELADMAKRIESAVVDAVDLALKPRQVVRRHSLVRDPYSIDIDGRHSQIISGSWLALRLPNNVELYRATRVADASRAEFLLTGKTTRVTVEGEYISWLQNLENEHIPLNVINALKPLWNRTFSTSLDFRNELETILNSIVTDHDTINNYKRIVMRHRRRSRFSNEVRTTEVFAQSEELDIAETPFYNPVMGNTIELSGIINMPAPPRTLLVQGHAARIKMISNVKIIISILGENNQTYDVIYGDVLTIVKPYSNSGDESGSKYWVRNKDGHEGHLSVTSAFFQFIPSDPLSPMITEIAELKNSVENDEHTTIELTSPLQYAYDPATVTIFANVAPSTHGETVNNEILGSGDATLIKQRFTLKQKPLTFVPSADPSGCTTTLEIWVNDIKWKEVNSLYRCKPKDRVYTTRLSDDGTVTVQFGDGIRGARLPSGTDNVRAIYRKGIGAEGLVRPGQLSLLMTRPLGVRSVTNPISSANAAAPQSIDDCRRNAPSTVLTLNRIVSLQDYEDFACGFGGIAKAHAVWIKYAQGRGVFLTIAGINGGSITGERINELKASILKNGDPRVPVRINSYTNVPFTIEGGFTVDAEYNVKKIETTVKELLKKKFSFSNREFGQPVALSEIIGLIQGVDGVMETDVLLKGPQSRDTLYLVPQTPMDGAFEENVKAAGLLTINSSCISFLEVKTV